MYHTNKLLSLLNYNLAATKKVIHFLSCVQPDTIRGSEANVRTYMFYARICLYPPKAKAKGHNLKVRITLVQFGYESLFDFTILNTFGRKFNPTNNNLSQRVSECFTILNTFGREFNPSNNNSSQRVSECTYFSWSLFVITELNTLETVFQAPFAKINAREICSWLAKIHLFNKFVVGELIWLVIHLFHHRTLF